MVTGGWARRSAARSTLLVWPRGGIGDREPDELRAVDVDFDRQFVFRVGVADLADAV